MAQGIRISETIKDRVRRELQEVLSLYASVSAEFHGYKMLKKIVLKRALSKIPLKNSCRLKNFLIYEKAFNEIFRSMIKHDVINVKRQKKYLISLKTLTLDSFGERYGE